MDVDFDCVGSNLPRQPKNLIFDQLLRDRAAFPAHQEFENGRLSGRQDLRFVIYEALPAFGVECEIGNLKRASEQLARAPQERFQSSDEFFECERLDEIIICTTTKTADTIVQASTCCKYQNRTGILALPYLAKD